MPYKDKEIEKMYYSIGEVADMFGVSTSLVRFWEKEFDILKPKKNKKGDRFFTQKDVENLKVIYHLVKERGFTLKGAQKKLKENKDSTISHVQVIQSLQKLKDFLSEIKKDL